MAATGAGDGAGKEAPVFLTPQSLTAFTGGSTAVFVLRTAAQALFAVDGPAVTFISALIVGVLVFLISLENNRPTSRRAWAVAIGVAFINSLYLALSVLGLTQS
jgi:hypothetical protein